MPGSLPVVAGMTIRKTLAMEGWEKQDRTHAFTEIKMILLVAQIHSRPVSNQEEAGSRRSSMSATEDALLQGTPESYVPSLNIS